MRTISRIFLIVLIGLMFASCGKKSGIEGKVTDGKGKPMANVKIIANQVQPIKGYEHFETTTSSDGTYRFNGLFPTSEYTLFAWGDNLEPQTKVTVKSGPEGQISMLPSDMMIRFATPKDGVITDTGTGLQWVQDVSSQKMTWFQANAYVQGLKIGGYSGWRLPSKEEIESLLGYANNRGVNENINLLFNERGLFKNVQSINYWSSTSYAYYTDFAWVVNMWYGYVFGDDKSFNFYYVWPVRSGQ